MGHGMFLFTHKNNLTKAKRIPPTTKTTTLYFEIAVIHGATEMKPASAAPAPKVTSNAGRAQHSNVPTLVNRVKNRKYCLSIYIIRA